MNLNDMLSIFMFGAFAIALIAVSAWIAAELIKGLMRSNELFYWLVLFILTDSNFELLSYALNYLAEKML